MSTVIVELLLAHHYWSRLRGSIPYFCTMLNGTSATWMETADVTRKGND